MSPLETGARANASPVPSSDPAGWIDYQHFRESADERLDDLGEVGSGFGQAVEVILALAARGDDAAVAEQSGLKVAVVYLPDPSPVVEHDRREARDRLGIRSLPVTSEMSAVKIVRSLEEGYFVAIQGDRDYAGNGRNLPFLGRDVSFPVGPFRIAAAAGVPLLPVFVLRSEDGSYRTVVEAPIRVEAAKRGERDAAERAAMGAFVAILERTVRENREQWYTFSRFWEPPV